MSIVMTFTLANDNGKIFDCIVGVCVTQIILVHLTIGCIWQTSYKLFRCDGNDFQRFGFMSGIIIWGFKNNQYYKWTTMQNTLSELQRSKYFLDITIVVYQTFLTELNASSKHIPIYFCNDQSMWNGANGLGINQAAVCQFT